MTKALIKLLEWCAADKDREIVLSPKDAQQILESLQTLNRIIRRVNETV